jgi:hypothetical protein
LNNIEKLIVIVLGGQFFVGKTLLVSGENKGQG